MAQQSISRTGSRSYRSELRQRQAEQTRTRVLAAAAELFTEHGYARTTLAKIAQAAGVSPETVQLHGPKAALMIAAVEYAGFGVAGEGDILNLDVGRGLLAIQDGREALDYLLTAQVKIHQRTAPLAPALYGGASIDPELGRYLGDLKASIGKQFRRILTVANDRGWLRDDVPFDDLVETVAVIANVDTYLRITRDDGWSVERYRTWCRRMLTETVFR
ncbi:TetR/AcrR family transcriptional regulator [Mycobacterium gordonae]|uniref:HTH tetR-type domain-containing protein n=1 Tax=Mycobacterium gordonae TaxID=1778 RepID=A0A1A6BEW2_MYCGO|nr:TetR/AcrR family transcriptional regulator [Mycobacterium gordonae]MCV7010776.1 TetR/AcrR family transcriptional regulator [Mycobacterium gordonae]OBS00860.1 hypothetical protein A9W98_22860 [Mycobacterium gordonae]ODR20494.1 hypothetical protein BHQ23_15935 [Mycobacterium gordonae]ORV72557.1 hypothetical protein AWC08_03805 [Mycobacterium gordonae]